jgi:drug/metabolite transporter (DMT)-like permease
MLATRREYSQNFQHKVEGHLAMLLFSLIVAGSFSFGKTIANDIDPVALTAVRFVLAAGILGAILGASGRIRLADYQRPWRYFILGGLFLAYFVLMFEALKTAQPVSISAIFTIMPLAAALLDRVIFRRTTTWLIWVALLIGAAGALWVVFRGSWAAMISLSVGFGEVLFFIATLLHAIYAVLLPRLRRGEPVYATTLGVTSAAAVMLVVIFWPRVSATNWADVALYAWAVLLYLAVLATLGTFALITVAAARLPSAKVTAYTFLTPFWVVLLESILGNGLPAAFILFGGVPIAAALFLLLIER